MSTDSVTLPVVVGGVGAAESVAQLAAKKTLIVNGLTGNLNIEAKVGSADFCA